MKTIPSPSASPCPLRWLACLLAVLIGPGSALRLHAQSRPYIGYVYPAGGQLGTTFQVKLGGQKLDGINAATISGSGVKLRIREYFPRMNPQESRLLREQLKLLKPRRGRAPKPSAEDQAIIDRIEARLREYVAQPACNALASLVFVEVSVAPDAEPGEREIRLITPQGISNPLPFHLGRLPEHTRPPMLTAHLQVLGEEGSALRSRPSDEMEARVTLPCTLNGQIASREINRYRFAAKRGHNLVVSALARQLIPYIADAVPGWFEPVISLHDSNGHEIAFADDYQFRPDPVLHYTIPADGEYVLSVADAIHRGREDFVYRINIGELPWITSLQPAGAQVGVDVRPRMNGWNLERMALAAPGPNALPGEYPVTAHRPDADSNPIPFALDRLPSRPEQEPNDNPKAAQSVTLPLIIDGRIDHPGDSDVFRFQGNSNNTVVVATTARRLDSPLDSLLRITDAKRNLLAFNDDHEDLAAGTTTHQADSWLALKLPVTGDYYVWINDIAQKGGKDFIYRLRIGPPQPDFELRVAPSSITVRTRSRSTLAVYAQRKDGFNGPITVKLQDSPAGFSANPAIIPAGKNMVRITVQAPPESADKPVQLNVSGSATLPTGTLSHLAVPAEDQMQAFLWRQLVPARQLLASVYDPSYKAPLKRPLPPLPDPVKKPQHRAKAKFTKSQTARQLRELTQLFEDGLLTAAYFNEKRAECLVAE